MNEKAHPHHRDASRIRRQRASTAHQDDEISRRKYSAQSRLTRLATISTGDKSLDDMVHTIAMRKLREL